MSKYTLIHTQEMQEKISIYINSDCIVQKALLLKEIKSKTGLYYIELEEFLFEEKRTLIRINNINNLIPDLIEMLKNGQISKLIAYDLGTLSKEQQYEFYLAINEKSKLKKESIRKRKAEQNVKRNFLDENTASKNRSIQKSKLDGRLTWGEFLSIKQQYLEQKQIRSKRVK